MEPSVTSRPKLVSFTMFVPFLGIPHAGGEYVRRHYLALSDAFDVLVIAPGGSENSAAMKKNEGVQGTAALIIDPIRGIPRVVVNLAKFFRGVSLGVDVERSFMLNRQLPALLAGASVVEFQWTEAASMARRVRSMAPDAKFIVVAHDIVSQRWQREARTGGLARRAFYAGRAFFTKLAERRRFRSVDSVVVFSEKDARLARNIAPGCNVQAVNPPLYDEEMTDSRKGQDRTGRNVLFTGAFARPENHEAAMWLLREVWPTVQRAVPDARLILAGADPLPELRNLVEECDSATATGYVPDLGPYYREADIFVSPLLHGAGVKFKNITAMLWQIPILTTPVGAEGIGTENHYLGITDISHEFATLLTDALQNAERRNSVARQAYAWAQGRFGPDQFKSALETVYLEDSIAGV